MISYVFPAWQGYCFGRMHYVLLSLVMKTYSDILGLHNVYQVQDIKWSNHQHIWHDEAITWELYHQYWPFVRGIHQWLVDSPHKGTVMWKSFVFHDIIMISFVFPAWQGYCSHHMYYVLLSLVMKTYGDIVCVHDVCIPVTEHQMEKSTAYNMERNSHGSPFHITDPLLREIHHSWV